MTEYTEAERKAIEEAGLSEFQVQLRESIQGLRDEETRVFDNGTFKWCKPVSKWVRID